MRSRIKILAMARILLAIPICVWGQQPDSGGSSGVKITLDATNLGPINPNVQPILLVTPDGEHIFLAGNEGSRIKGYFDGHAGPEIRDIFRISNNNDRIRILTGSPVISADGKSAAYIVQLDGGKAAVIADATQSPPYDRVSFVAFAPAGHHLIYVAQRGNKQFMVSDGNAGMLYDQIATQSLVFSPDGAHLAYIATVNPTHPVPVGSQTSKPQPIRVVLDGVEQKHFAKIVEPTFSHDGKHFGYLAGAQGLYATRAVIDGNEGADYFMVKNLMLSEDGSRIVYMAYKDNSMRECMVVDNGNPGSVYAQINPISMSPDGRRIAYVAMTLGNAGSQMSVIDNGNQGREYTQCSNIQFSPDGKSMSYYAAAAGSFIVVNGQEYGPFDWMQSQVAYSSDGQHWAAAVRPTGGQQFSELIDGKMIALDSHFAADGSAFSRDDQRVMITGRSSRDGGPAMLALSAANPVADPNPAASIIAFSPNRLHQARLMIEGYQTSAAKETLTVDGKLMDTTGYSGIKEIRVSDDGQHVAFIASGGGTGNATTHALYDGNESPGYMDVSDLAMSPDGKHIAYAARGTDSTGVSYFVGIDDTQGPAFQAIQAIDPRNPNDVRELKFSPDGSLMFLAVFDNALHRCVYSASAVAAAAPLAQTIASGGAPGLHTLHTFTGQPDGNECHRLILGADETLYGVTRLGGKYTKGSLFSCKTDGTGYAVLHSFYGGDNDGEMPDTLAVGAEGVLYGGTTGSRPVVFSYDPKLQKYTVLIKDGSTSHFAGVSGSLLAGATDNNSLWTSNLDGSNLITHKQQFQLIGATCGPDGTIYVVTDKTLEKLTNPDAPSTTLHKFVDSPDDGTNPDGILSFDSDGRIYGYTRAGGNSSSGVIFSIKNDGTDYKLVCNPDQALPVGGVFAAENGAVYGIKKGDGFGRGGSIFSIPIGGGQPQTVGDYNDQLGEHPYFCHAGAIYGFTLTSIFKYQLGSSGSSSPATVAINPEQPAALQLSPMQFTEPTGAAGE